MNPLMLLSAGILLLSTTRNNRSELPQALNVSDTSEITFACLMDTGNVLWYYDFYYPDYLGSHVSCIMYNNGKFSDTGFILNVAEIMELDKQRYVREFLHYSKYFKKHDLIYLTRNEKRKFKGFRFKIFKRKVSYNTNEITYGKNCLWPAYNKYLRISKYGYILENIKILD